MAIYYSRRKELMQGEIATIGGAKSQRGRETREECCETQERLQNLSWSKDNGKIKLGEIPLGASSRERESLQARDTLHKSLFAWYCFLSSRSGYGS